MILTDIKKTEHTRALKLFKTEFKKFLMYI